MNKIKELYSSPTTKILVVRLEGCILTGSNNGFSSNHTEYLGTEEDGGDLS